MPCCPATLSARNCATASVFCARKPACPVELLVREQFVLDGLPVIGKCAGNIVAPNSQQQLALTHRVTQPRADVDDPARSERNHRNRSRNIGTHDAGYDQLRRGFVLDRGNYGKLLGMIDLNYIQILLVFYLSRRRSRSRACWVVHSLTLARSPRKVFSMHSVLAPSVRAM